MRHGIQQSASSEGRRRQGSSRAAGRAPPGLQGSIASWRAGVARPTSSRPAPRCRHRQGRLPRGRSVGRPGRAAAGLPSSALPPTGAGPLPGAGDVLEDRLFAALYHFEQMPGRRMVVAVPVGMDTGWLLFYLMNVDLLHKQSILTKTLHVKAPMKKEVSFLSYYSIILKKVAP